MIAKYVIVEHLALPVPLLCPGDAGVTHDDLAAGYRAVVVSAGFCDTDSWAAYGESVSLGKQSRGADDSVLLRQYFQPTGIYFQPRDKPISTHEN